LGWKSPVYRGQLLLSLSVTGVSSFLREARNGWVFLAAPANVTGPGIKPCHISDLSYSRDNAKSLTHCATRELPGN